MIEKIKAEIEKQIWKICTPEGFVKKEDLPKYEVLNELSDLIESLEKEPHYTKRNAIFDECVKNCDPKVMKKVSDEIDKMLEKEHIPDAGNMIGLDEAAEESATKEGLLDGPVHNAAVRTFKAGAKWQAEQMPKWSRCHKQGTFIGKTATNILFHNGYCIEISELFKKLPKEE